METYRFTRDNGELAEVNIGACKPNKTEYKISRYLCRFTITDSKTGTENTVEREYYATSPLDVKRIIDYETDSHKEWTIEMTLLLEKNVEILSIESVHG